MGLHHHQRRPAPAAEPVDGLPTTGRRPRDRGGRATHPRAPIGAHPHNLEERRCATAQARSRRRRSAPSERTPSTRRTPRDVAKQQHAPCTIGKGNVIYRRGRPTTALTSGELGATATAQRENEVPLAEVDSAVRGLFPGRRRPAHEAAGAPGRPAREGVQAPAAVFRT